MPPISRVGDIGLGHASFPPTPITSGSGDTNANSISAARQSDSLAPHNSSSPSPIHGRSIASGSSTVYINGMPAVRIGDAVSCGGMIATGGGDIIVGG